MQITGLALVPPPGAKDNPKVTPELLASCLAKYSRSNQGILSILNTVDWNDPDRSVDRIFRFVDYGHASIAGMTGGIAMAVDGISMLLAYKLFEIAQLCDGQESSTRYIEMSPDNLPTAEEVGIPAQLAKRWEALLARAFAVYQEIYEALDERAKINPEIIRAPEGAPAKVVERLRRNYALDRARYLIPFATLTNCAFVMTARIWAETIRRLDSLEWPEARRCAAKLREELEKFSPRLIRHSYRDEPSVAQAVQLEQLQCRYIVENGVRGECLQDQVFVSVSDDCPQFLPHFQSIKDAFRDKKNRYSNVGERLSRIMVRFGWNNVSLAELRDLNRHRSGYRFAPLIPVGFYLPEEVNHPGVTEVVQEMQLITAALAKSGSPGAHLYGYLLGVQTPFEHSTHADKFIYEIELRTGMGAHFRYAEHLAAAYHAFVKQMPECRDFITLGTAEPE